MLVIVLISVFAVVGGQGVYAKSETEIAQSIMDKAVLQGVQYCYNYGYIQPSFDSLDSYVGVSSLLTDKNGEDDVALVTGVGADGVFKSLGANYNIKDGNISCSELFKGAIGDNKWGTGGSNQGVLDVMGHPAPNRSNVDAVIEFFDNMGYSTSIGSDRCVSLEFTIGKQSVNSNKVCSGNGGLYVEGTGDYNGSVNFSIENGAVCLAVLGDLNDLFTNRKLGCAQINSAFNADALKGAIADICGENLNCDGYKLNRESGGNSERSLSNVSAVFANGSAEDAGLEAVKFLSNGKISSLADLKISEPEKRILYQEYLTSYYDVEVLCDDVSFNDGLGTIRWFNADSGSMETCYYDADPEVVKNVDKPVNGVANGWLQPKYPILGMEKLIGYIGNLPTDYSDDELAELGAIASESSYNNQSATGGSSSGSADKCGAGGGAGALGWIVCPILNWAQEAVKDIYDNFLKPNLQLEPQLFTSSNGNTLAGWEVFQGIANGLFIILLLVVVFSQLTGVGIDNYGIKRILPKMIVTAVLVNLSFILCQIFVDLSNILGNGFQALFDNIPVNGVGNSGIDVGSGAEETIVSVAVLAGVGTTAVLSWATIANPAVLMSLLVSAIGVLISMFFLFILLAAREAAVVVLTVISPLAFVCYMLPNTKKLFDRWVKIMEALLLVYPIAGLLVGGGNYVSKLLLSVGVGGEGFISALTAMVVGIIPIFFIPTVLRSSFAGLGNLGARISGIGARLSHGATGRIRNSEGYKLQQQRGQEWRTYRRSGLRRGADGRYERDAQGNLVQRGGLAGVRSRFAETGVGRLLGADRRLGRDRAKAVADQQVRRLDVQNMDLAMLGAQQAKNESVLNTRAGEADTGVVEVTRELARQEAEARRNQQQAKNNEGIEVPQLGVIEQELRETNAAIAAKNQVHAEGNLVMKNQSVFEQELRNKSVDQLAENQLGVPEKTYDEAYMRQDAKVRKQQLINDEGLGNLQTRLNNEVNDIMADNQVPVLGLDVGTAVQRKQAARDSQEFRNYSDQFANFDKSALQAEANNAATWLGQSGSTQRMSALLQHMESNGMENQIADMLRNVDVSNNSGIMSMLASSKNKVFRAYGKKGAGVTYDDFMGQTAWDETRDDGSVVHHDRSRIQEYVDEKGVEFSRDIDDKALREVARYSNDNNQIMRTELLADAASGKVRSQDALNYINTMLGTRGDISISGEQLAGMNASTVQALYNTADGRQALRVASDDVARNDKLQTRVDVGARGMIDAVRDPRANRNKIWNASPPPPPPNP
ncbi:hypothetical protein IKE79_01235 [Candidatus Saccharibacteria bacterium]|nr:hypothetical protein [Candidatus Saccharibacteria bacterium]